MNKQWVSFLFIGILLVITGITIISSRQNNTLPPLALTSPQPTPSNIALVLGTQTKIEDCQIINSLPDSECTPGAVFPDVTAEQICTSGYSSSVRNVPQSEKNQVYTEYGIATHTTGEYEVDHLISLEIGGSNDIANLWPEAASPTPGFHEKDKVENYLHSQICSGKISLSQAQEEIAHQWLKVYQDEHL